MHASPGPAPPMLSGLAAFADAMQAPVVTVLPSPVHRKRRNEIPPNFIPRRSGHIALSDRGLDSEMKAKRVLLRRMGLLQDDEPLSDALLAKYSALFKQPLAEDVIQAFADFYDWSMPSVKRFASIAASPCSVEG